MTTSLTPHTHATAKLIDGKEVAAQLRNKIADHAIGLAKLGITPGLAVVLVGDDPASQVYVRNKHKQSIEVGFNSFEHKLPTNTTQAELLALVEQLNQDPSVHGILVQLPLPKHIHEQSVLQAIDPAKDVDGFHPLNAGKLAIGDPLFVPCTPVGCEILLRSVMPDPSGLHAVVLGRSNIVGKPVAQLLLAANCTVTTAHSRTRDLPALIAQADVLIAAIGKPNFVRGAWLKPGAIVIDVGINRVADERVGAEPGKTRLVGDVHFEEALHIASAITPVPGGVGPMTIACLLRSTLLSACHANGLALPTNLHA
jgi:methylenetetrahydrofolate dehydrogenase (NADP+) / methenyltetrahydrofolate cyclohydrolase